MGLKIKNHTLENTGITIPNAYAQIASANVDLDGKADYVVAVQTERENIGKLKTLETFRYKTTIDKDLPMHERLYTHLKAQAKFKDWEDDIVE